MKTGAAIAVGLIIGLVAGGLGGYGLFSVLAPAPPKTYTLTIINQPDTPGYAFLTWTPANAGSNFSYAGEYYVTIVFEENTNVTLQAGGDPFLSFSGTNGADVHMVSSYRAWIVMDGNKVIMPSYA